MQLLLISNSTLYGSGYLDHAESEIRDFLGEVKRVLFVPYALHDRDAYAETAIQRFAKMGYELSSSHTTAALLCSFVGAALALLGGWFGGELVERLGVGVYPDADLNAPNSLTHGTFEADVRHQQNLHPTR